jgi:predicted MPP superfamily phosphohydrolase
MEEKFFDDLATLHAKTGPWDLVLFTGDLTYQGNSEEFQKTDKLLEKLWNRLRELGSTPSLLAVPGNHDLTRPDPDPAQPEVVLLQEWSVRPAIRSEFWDKPGSPYRRVVKKAFQNRSHANTTQPQPPAPRWRSPGSPAR